MRPSFFAIIDGAGLSMASWSAGTTAWATVPGFDEAGDQQGVLVTPGGAIYVDYSPPGTENFTYQRVVAGATATVGPCTGDAMVFAENGSVDAASDVFFEDCPSATLYMILQPAARAIAPVVAMPQRRVPAGPGDARRHRVRVPDRARRARDVSPAGGGLGVGHDHR